MRASFLIVEDVELESIPEPVVAEWDESLLNYDVEELAA